MQQTINGVATFRAGAGSPLVLLHIGANPWRKWDSVVDEFTPRHEVIIPTLACFAGGPKGVAPATIEQYADRLEEVLDAAGVGKAHFAGNSLGAWLSMEMGRRQRALSVVAFSPAGGYTSKWRQFVIRQFFTWNKRLRRMSGHVTPLVLRFAWARKLALRAVAERGDSLTTQRAIDMSTDTMRGDIKTFLTIVSSEGLAKPYPAFGVPTILVWCEKDRIMPLSVDGEHWRKVAPHADWRVLPGSGHIPMIDAPEATAHTILEAIDSA